MFEFMLKINEIRIKGNFLFGTHNVNTKSTLGICLLRIQNSNTLLLFNHNNSSFLNIILSKFEK